MTIHDQKAEIGSNVIYRNGQVKRNQEYETASVVYVSFWSFGWHLFV
jgi:hypothetical protein